MEISDFIDNDYKSFAKYTLYSRAIPSLVDGLKPVQRKALYCMLNNQSKVKVMSLAGKMISDGNYNHGDGPACQAISAMAQDFVGANNIPFFHKKGSFGNKLVKEPSAPRYIYVKNNPFYKKVFLDKYLEQKDLEHPEPKYFIPIIPTILLNGIKGMAVGFATEILPYNIDDIKLYVKQYIKDPKGTLPKLKPFYKDYKGKIDLQDNKWVMHGKYKIINTTTIHITEIPIQFDREKYLKHLSSLIDKNLINSFKCKSKETWDITIRLKRNSKVFNDPEKYLKLYQILSENITTIDENGKLKIFETVYDLMDYFIEFRLKIYSKRKDYMINLLTDDIEFIKQKIKIIQFLTKINFKKMTYDEILSSIIEQFEYPKVNIINTLKVNAYNLNIDYINKLKQKIIDNEKELKYYKKITKKELYITDLKELK